MRNAFAQEVTALAPVMPELVLLAGDIGNRLFDDFKAAAPKRFYNCGIAEANMVGMAAGLAMSGLRPVCYTIAPFITYRVIEQIRIDLCYHHLPVILVGTGAGLSYASLGGTHHSCEDIGMMRLLPGMVVMAPGDAQEVRGCLRAALKQKNPVYIRIGKKGEPVIHASVPEIEIGRALVLQEPATVTLMSTGNMLSIALDAAKQLQQQGVATGVISTPTVKPLDTELLRRIYTTSKIVATIEEHSVLGGLGGSIAEWASEFAYGSPTRLLRFGTADEFIHTTCEQEEAQEHSGLTAPAIVKRILRAQERV
jgi:transketolase